MGDSAVWVGFMDGHIEAIDTQSQHSVAAMTAGDVVTCLVAADDGQSVWCATLRGDIIQWDAETHRRLASVPLPELLEKRVSLMSIVPVKDRLWCGCGNALSVYNVADGRVEPFPDHSAPLSPQAERHQRQAEAAQPPPPPTPEEEFRALEKSIRQRSRQLADRYGDDAGFSIHKQPFHADPLPEKKAGLVYSRQPAAAHHLVRGLADEVWGCSRDSGLVQIWNTETMQQAAQGGEWTLDCNGLTVLWATAGHVWGAGNNDTVYVWDLASHQLLRHLTGHTDSVRSLCDVGHDDQVASGAASSDGTVIVWQLSRTPDGRT